jgi:hypothetical protein
VDPARFNELMVDLRDWWGNPPGWIFHVLLLTPISVVLWDASFPGGSNSLAAIFALMVSWFLFIAATAFWGVRLAVTVASRRRSPRRAAWWWLVAPMLAILLVTALLTDASLRLRFAASRGSFDGALQSEAVPTSPPEGDPLFDDIEMTRVGLYRIFWVRRLDGGSALFYT